MKNRKTLIEISEEVVRIVNNESTDYDANEKVLEHLTHSLKLGKESTIDKWANLSFLDGLKGHVKPNIAALYESYPSRLLSGDTKDNS